MENEENVQKASFLNKNQLKEHPKWPKEETVQEGKKKVNKKTK